MNIWFDFGHIPQYNFGCALIQKLAAEGHTIYVTVLQRGRLYAIAQQELADLSNVHVYAIGNHGLTKWSAIWNANVKRIIKMFCWAWGKHIDCAISSTLPCALVAKLIGAKMFAYTDDTQRGTYPWIIRFCTTETNLLVPPEGKLAIQKTTVLNALKEWAYLAPNVFRPNATVLDKYGVQPKQYIFLREVSVGTVNYAGQAAGAIRDVASVIENRRIEGIEDRRLKVLFSLEEKNRRAEYPDDWILLQEPIEDIHSLIYYSAGLVSSGDSMAREAALLGVPAYYLGIRYSMPANLAASKVANLQNATTMPFEQWIDSVCDSAKSVEERVNEQNILRDKIDHEFIDINAYMLSLVDKVAQEKKND